MQNIKIAPTFFIIKNVVKTKNVKKVKNVTQIKKRKKRFLHLCSDVFWNSTSLSWCNIIIVTVHNDKHYYDYR